MSTVRIVAEANGDPVAKADARLRFGSRVGADVVIDDPVLAPLHCEVTVNGDAFELRDLGSVSGTWLDGQRVQAAMPLRDGSRIVLGTATMAAAIADGCLTLTIERSAFFWNKPKKGAFDNDPDALVRAEVGFGRFPALRLGNRLALLVGGVLAIGATFVTAIMEPLADAGPLLPSHALVAAAASGKAAEPAHLAAAVATAKEQGCNSCHTTGHGVTATDCLSCHGDLARAPTFRHPYVGDGALGPLPGIDAGEGFCVVCHIDHQGKDWLKPASAMLVGKCASCHGRPGEPFDAQALVDRIPEPEVATGPQAIAAYAFPHGPHVGKQIPCSLCHRVDDSVRALADAGLPANPGQQDYREIAFETCASCHVDGAAAVGMTAAEQAKFRATERQWPVAWHGSDDGGKHCLPCHSQAQRDGRTVFGPEFNMVDRGIWTADQYAEERARYTTPTRSHREQFAAHAAGRECTGCHVRGEVAIAAPPPLRTFWHGLHLAEGALAPAAGLGAAVSSDAKAGCVSCHSDLGADTGLTAAGDGGYHWPTDAAAQAACNGCHRDGEQKPVLAAAVATATAERLQSKVDFPHGPHVDGAMFGKAGGKLEAGCFACHEFAATTTGRPHELVPRTKAAASDCRSCHAGHDHVGGGSCQKCHPADPARSNSFLLSAAVPVGSAIAGRQQPVPAPPTRSWPRNDGFSHLSPGHRDPAMQCTQCHDQQNLEQAMTLEAIAIPDDRTRACRDCHLQQQFHWR